MTIEQLLHRLDRTVEIAAPRAAVFRFFTDPARWAAWWGAGSTIDPRAGGRVFIRYPNGVEAAGEVVSIEPPDRLVFTFGYVSGTPFAPGESVVTLRLEPSGAGTNVHLSHAFGEARHRDEHVQGWRYQLSLFANAVASDVFADAATTVDDWFAAWSEDDDGAREAAMRRLATAEIRMRDQFSAIHGLDDLLTHVAAARRFMPGLRMTREGRVRHCQGVLLADWIVRTAAGDERGRGSNVFTLAPDGKIEGVTGFWQPPS